uniref:Uncharacterized protein n=1 Tax=Knipowitschia caucasica TaxID=637954 RepID=A0AAV2JL89_KNICA
MQAALIQQLKSENLDLQDKIVQQQAAIESTSHALHLTQTQANSLLKHVAQMTAQEEMMRAEEWLLKVQLEDNNKQFKAAANKFQTELAEAQHNACTSEIHKLKKLVSSLKSSQSRAEAEAAELRTQTKVLRSEVKEEKLGKEMVIYKTARKTQLFHRYRKKMADKRELFSTMTTMLNSKVFSVRTSPTHSKQEVAELRRENQELKEKLENRPDEPFKQLYWAKKTINKQQEKITLLKAECMMYYDLSTRKKEESEALQQEVARLKQQEVTRLKHQEVTRLKHEEPNQRAHTLTRTRIPAVHAIPVFNDKGLIVSGIVMGGGTLKGKKLVHKKSSLEPNHI